ncbi:MAG: imidazole glycerol phosphate synthase subunit HisH [Pseudomonadota bacterium]
MWSAQAPTHTTLPIFWHRHAWRSRSGNLRSVHQAVQKAGAEANDRNIYVQVSDSAQAVLGADHIILPGQGAFLRSIDNLRANPDLLDALCESILHKKRPFLGICVGMQLLADIGVEHDTSEGLGWLGGACLFKQEAHDNGLNLPHMGWNKITPTYQHALMQGLDAPYMYFANSYHYVPKNTDDILATYDYGAACCAIVARDNIAGVQFHPEKSHDHGLRLLQNFCTWHI